MDPLVTAGTRPLFGTRDESGLYVNEFSVSPKRTYDDVVGVPDGGTAPQTLFSEGHTVMAELSFSGHPIPASDGSFVGLVGDGDSSIVASLANLADPLLGVDLTVGVTQARDISFKGSRSGTGREFTVPMVHFPFMS